MSSRSIRRRLKAGISLTPLFISIFVLCPIAGAHDPLYPLPRSNSSRFSAVRWQPAVLRLSDLKSFPLSPHDVIYPAQAFSTFTPPATLPLDGAVNIDIAMFYSPSAFTQVGGQKAMLAEAVNVVRRANKVFEDSGVDAQFSLVYVGALNVDESGSFLTDLERFQNTSDGFFDEIHSIRMQFGADLVTFMRETFTTEHCGIAYQYNDPATSFPDYAFQVVSRECFSIYTFEHEVGHTCGANHDAGNVENDGPFDFARGNIFTGNDGLSYQTVMTITEGPLECGLFSSPAVSFQGQPTGNSSADNVLAMDTLASNVAAYESSTSSPVSYTFGKAIKFADILSSVKKGSKCKISGQVFDKKVKGIKNAPIMVQRFSDQFPLSPIRFTNRDGIVNFTITSPGKEKVFLKFIDFEQRSKAFRCR